MPKTQTQKTKVIQLVSFRRTAFLFTLCVLLSLFLVGAFFLHVLTIRAIDIVGMVAKDRMLQKKAEQRKSCLESPVHWSRKLPNGALLYAYNIQTFRSLNPKAPTLPANLVRQIQNGKKKAYSQLPLLKGGGHFLVKINASGECSLLYVQWKMANEDRIGIVLMLSAAFCLALLICLFLSYLWIARPLLRRIRTLAALTKEVGDETHTQSWPIPVKDDLGTIEQSLAQAHSRILHDKQVLASKNKALREHFANVAHDLRTPIASLQLVLEHVIQKQHTPELMVALDDVVYLEQLINNLSLAASFEEGLWQLRQKTTINLNELLVRVQARFALLAKQKGISLEVSYPDSPVLLNGDAMMLERAVSNLVHNALHYNQRGGHVVMLLQQKKGSFTLQVVDDGMGVLPEDLPKLNVRLFRSDRARQRKQTGQGLGLAITQEVCQVHQLSLFFERMEPQGLSVCITGKCLF